MKWIVEYIENAIKFEHLAALERNAEVRAKLETQAAAYRKLAEARAHQIGVPPRRIGSEPNPDVCVATLTSPQRAPTPAMHWQLQP